VLLRIEEEFFNPRRCQHPQWLLLQQQDMTFPSSRNVLKKAPSQNGNYLSRDPSLSPPSIVLTMPSGMLSTSGRSFERPLFASVLSFVVGFLGLVLVSARNHFRGKEGPRVLQFAARPFPIVGSDGRARHGRLFFLAVE